MHLPTLLQTIILLSSPLITSAFTLPSRANSLADVTKLYRRQSTAQHDLLQRETDEIIDRYLERRQQPGGSAVSSSAAPSSAPSSSPSSAASSAAASAPSSAATGTAPPINPAQWDADTKAACMSSLKALNGSTSSISGMAVCYNIPYLNNITGVFQADLRLYRVAPATNAWTNVKDGDVSIDLTYVGASVSPSSPDPPSSTSNKRSLEPRVVITMTPTFLQGFNFVGQMNRDLLNTPLNLTTLRAYLAPTVHLSTPDPSDPSGSNSLQTTLSPKDASFVNGLLSQGSSTTCSTLACVPTGLEAGAALKGGYNMPGMTLGIFPVGLIITSSWALLGAVVMAWGTVGKLQFRGQYRRRVQRGIMAAAAGKRY